ncbi:N-formylglutamate amidohydrolase [Nordella sp. HKS 07]|uniref:N-formylglutamate amidohydrolase n=1 Tax=Nordella sp. HKS 07 TaxID=2712222 RepID=UPI0013E19289|nr:N-formylglutamate amidohydrolase [Nordella sp. HKS 07]QIG49704.1 N-formylglutamate amidohydrolase [Nordella sp. HKS 07]
MRAKIDPPAAETVNPDGKSPYVLLCEHASNYIPARYRGLGLDKSELERHIAWDIGVAPIARDLSKALDAPLVLSGYSRLLIDCNRPVGVATAIPEISESTRIPGNTGLSAEERQLRADAFYWPFQRAVARILDRRQAAKMQTIVFGVHSFTPVFKGVERPWHAGILFRKAQAFGQALVAALQEPGLNVVANEPYRIEDDGDQTVPVHGEARGLDAVLIEIRQDLIGHRDGQIAWAKRLAPALQAAADARAKA